MKAFLRLAPHAIHCPAPSLSPVSFHGLIMADTRCQKTVKSLTTRPGRSCHLFSHVKFSLVPRALGAALLVPAMHPPGQASASLDLSSAPNDQHSGWLAGTKTPRRTTSPSKKAYINTGWCSRNQSIILVKMASLNCFHSFIRKGHNYSSAGMLLDFKINMFIPFPKIQSLHFD